MESVNKTLSQFAGALGARFIAAKALAEFHEAGEEGKDAYIARAAAGIVNPGQRAQFIQAATKN